MADDRQEPGEEDPANSVALHEELRALESFGFDEDDPAPAKNYCPANPSRYPVANRRAQPRTEGPGQNHAAEAHAALGGPEGGGWNDNFARHRQDRAFHRHQGDHAEIY